MYSVKFWKLGRAETDFAKVVGTLVTVTVTVTVNNFRLEILLKMKWHSPNIYRRPQKNFGPTFQSKIFHGRPLLWGYV